MLISRRAFLLSSTALVLTNDANAWLPHGTANLLAPSAPSLDLAAASDTGSSYTDKITNNSTPDIDVVFGTLPLENDVVVISDGGTTIATHTITATEITNSAFNLRLSALSDGTHVLTASHSSGGLTSAFGPALTIIVDTLAPILSTPTGAQNVSNDTHSDLYVSTNTADGVLYWIVTNNATPPSSAQIVAGQDHSGLRAISNGVQNVVATGTQTAIAFGITTANTYYAYFTHEDVAGNLSSVVGSSSWAQTPGTGFDVLTTIAPNLWLAADDRFTLWKQIAGSTQVASASDPVGKWDDKSGNTFNLTALVDVIPGSTQNVSVPKFQNSQYRCVSFDGLNDVIGKTAALGLAASITSHAGSTICMAIKPNPSSGRYLIAEFVTSGQEIFFSIASDATTASKWVATVRNDAGGLLVNNQTLGTSVYDNQWKVLTFIDDGTKFIGRVNGTQVGTYTYGTVGTLTSANFALGNSSLATSSFYFAADIAEIVIKLSGSISGTNLAHLETYMGAKVGLSI